MKYTLAIAALAACIGSSAALAQSNNAANPATSPNPPVKLSQSECSNLWSQVNSSNAKGLTQGQVGNYVSDFKAANPDGDTTIDQNEWMAACNKGLIRNSSSSGASSGTSGSSGAQPSEHPPTKSMNEAVPQMTPDKAK